MCKLVKVRIIRGIYGFCIWHSFNLLYYVLMMEQEHPIFRIFYLKLLNSNSIYILLLILRMISGGCVRRDRIAKSILSTKSIRHYYQLHRRSQNPQFQFLDITFIRVLPKLLFIQQLFCL